MHQRLPGKPLEGFAEFSMNVAAQGAVLLKNRPETLPLESLDRVAIFGRSQINYYRSGTGSGGAVNVIATCNLLEAMRERCGARVNGLLAQRYEQWVMSIRLITAAVGGHRSPGINRRCRLMTISWPRRNGSRIKRWW